MSTKEIKKEIENLEENKNCSSEIDIVEENSTKPINDTCVLKVQMHDSVQLQWVIDLDFKKIQEKFCIPKDPQKWSRSQVKVWLKYVTKKLNIDEGINLNDWSHVDGNQLCKLNLKQFRELCPNDTNLLLWANLEILKQVKFVSKLRTQFQNCNEENQLTERTSKTSAKEVSIFGHPSKNNLYRSQTSTNQNSSILLWQFLLELLTDKTKINIIRWLNDGEFKFLEPEQVAKLWGERKKNPNMNYEKMARALRYYYEGNMISKVSGKQYVYKYVCDLKDILGYSSDELAQLVQASAENLNNV